MTAPSTASRTVRPGTWRVDPATATAGFRVRNFGLRWVEGTFRVTRGVVVVGADGRPTLVQATVDASSVTTGISRRDADLRGPRFFDVEHHAEIDLVARQVEPTDGGWRVHADVGVRGAPAPIELAVRSLTTDGSGGGPVLVEATGVLDLRTTPIRAPRALVGRFVEVRIKATLLTTDSDPD